jgi:1,4-dihydroxy-2-naphthoate octaprenyltransferase
MKADQELLSTLETRGYTHAVIAFVDDDGYPLSVATGFNVAADRRVVVLDWVAGEAVTPPLEREINVVFSHIHPQPGQGYDERRYVSFWGRLRRTDGKLELTPERVQHWDEEEMTFFEYSERGVPQAHRYMERLSRELGRPVRPKLSRGWLFLRATRLPFLTATVIPTGLGISVAALDGRWTWWLAILTLIAAMCVHLGLNVTNDIFDTKSGADAANVTPTQFSGGSRVIHYGLLSMRQMQLLAAGFYAVGLGIGLYLAVTRAFWPLLTIGVIGAAISLFYTAPPFRLVHRGLGEIAVFLGFGPIMALGAYYVQAQRFSWEAVYASLPIGILIALVLYVNEIPDRPGDAAAGKRTLPVRWSKQLVIRAYAAAVSLAFTLILVGVLTDLLPVPAILAMAAVPLARPVFRGLERHYDEPYALMPFMGTNIKLHFATGMLMILGYGIAIAANVLMDNPPFILR